MLGIFIIRPPVVQLFDLIINISTLLIIVYSHKKLLPKDFIDEIQKIAKTDEFTQGLYQHIIELPDMSEDQKEQQMVEFDKSNIEHGPGFIEWEKWQLEWMKDYNENEKKIVLDRLKLLKKWAIENNMMNPKLERLKEEGFFKKRK